MQCQRQDINNMAYTPCITMTGGGHANTDDYEVINDDYYTNILNDQNVKITQNPAYVYAL